MINPEREQIVKELCEELNKEYPEYGFGYYISNALWLVVSKAPYKEYNGWSLFKPFDEINKGYANDIKNELRTNLIKLKNSWNRN